MTEQTISERVEAVLREHAYEWVTGRRWRCPCDSLVRTPDQHRAHIAEQTAAALVPVVAEAEAEAARAALLNVSAELYRDHDMPPNKDGKSYGYRMGWWDGDHHAAKVVRDRAEQIGQAVTADV